MSDRPVGCSEIFDKVSPYVDGELGAAERSLVEAHLAVCPPCAEIAGEIREIDARAARLPVPGVSNEEWTLVLGRVVEGRQKSRILDLRRNVWRWTLPLAAAVLGGSVFLGPWFPSKAPDLTNGVEEMSELPEIISGPPPSSIDRVDDAEGGADDASHVQYLDF
jgi:anti-sigma factor RsiW